MILNYQLYQVAFEGNSEEDKSWDFQAFIKEPDTDNDIVLGLREKRHQCENRLLPLLNYFFSDSTIIFYSEENLGEAVCTISNVSASADGVLLHYQDLSWNLEKWTLFTSDALFFELCLHDILVHIENSLDKDYDTQAIKDRIVLKEKLDNEQCELLAPLSLSSKALKI
jgi:hypothetical protein